MTLEICVHGYIPKTCLLCKPTPLNPQRLIPQQKEVWQTPTYLGALADAEGSFHPYIHYTKKTKRWYVHVRFVLEMKATPQWQNISTYWQKIYGGTLRRYKPTVWRRPELPPTESIRWVIYRIRELTIFLHDIHPHLYIKKQDAEKVARFLARYTQLPSGERGQPTRQQAQKLWQQLSR
jgi:hypothetical protein